MKTYFAIPKNDLSLSMSYLFQASFLGRTCPHAYLQPLYMIRGYDCGGFSCSWEESFKYESEN